jgi:phospholipase C
MANQLSAINHIVVLALENRSFDQMLGFLYTDQGNKSPAGHEYEGLTGNESNPDANGKPVKVFKITPDRKNAYFMPGCDPGEAYPQVNRQLFGSIDPPSPPVATNQGFLTDFADNLAQRRNQTRWHVVPGTAASDIMGMFAPETLPVLSALARGYAVCDHWFASVPTETMPNRAFMCAGTSQGKLGDTNVTPFTVPSIFGRLSAAGIDWSIYGYNAAPYTRSDFPDTKQAPDSHFGQFNDFKNAAEAGKLPAYTFLEPEWSAKGNSQHPNYDVALGEQLISDVYYALKNGKDWNETLLIITYDEHGGNFDHVPPPMGAIPPDNSLGDLGFDFKRFGVRVPAVLVSPLIAPGTVFRVPDGTMPIDHTSILKTIERRWGLIPLTARDAAAPDVGDALTLTKPRTDDALAGVKVPKSTGTSPGQNAPSHLQEVRAQTVANLIVPDSRGRTYHEMPKVRTNRDYTNYINRRTAAWQKSNQHRRAAVARRPSLPSPAQPVASGTVALGGKAMGPAQVVILRHGEKPSDPRNPDLSPVGERRADMLATAIPQLFPHPDFLFAAAPSKHSNRPVETLTPLARALTMPIDTDIADDGYSVLAADLLDDPRYAGKLIIVCWHHGNIPDLGLALKVPKEGINNAQGMEGMHWDSTVFDLFWSIKWPGQVASLAITKQLPLPTT